VTGTDTGVGKTVVSAALMRRYRGSAPRYWKPIQTGIEQDDDSAEVARLSGCEPSSVLSEGVRLPRPVSPHLAARIAGVTIAVGALERIAAAHPTGGPWIVEGAGGVLVPLNDRELIIDLMGRLGLPTVVAARSGLGTINHTLLTLEALTRRSIPVAGVVMVGAPDAENRRAIEAYGQVSVVGELPRLAPLDPASLAAWADTALDVRGQLSECFA
jgi:dethiobiotin synthase